MLILLKLYWQQAAIVGCALILVWAIKYYGTTQFESGASEEKIQVTKDLEKNVQLRYAAEVKKLDTAKQELVQMQVNLDVQSQVISADRASFNRNIAIKLSAIDIATKGNLTDASKTPDDQLNALARQWIARLSARTNP